MFAETADLYDLFYEWKDYAGEAARIRELAEARAPGAHSLLDVACGTGRHLEHLRAWYEVEGVDLDEGLLEVARRRLPDVRLGVADMRDFDLGRRFDVVTCLFSSIGYVGTPEALRSAIAAMGRHVAPGGMLLVEPWLTPETFDPAFPSRAIVVERPGLHGVRLNDSRVDGRLSVMDFHYLLARPGQRIEHVVETHTLGLFTDDEHRAAFEAAGLTVEHDESGLMGRGLWIGRRQTQ
ncbi:MAG: class I SAM-dependent methyltransferase [Chloroflexi bacterium]|nr:class I SAM-dependent methyltransferase [Chloroflexota bacterium]